MRLTTKSFRQIRLCLGLLCVLSMVLVSVPTAFAANSSTDPIVVIAVDATVQVNCQYKATFNIGTAQEATVQHPCDAGSVMSNAYVHLSQARAQHKQYVQLPSSSASLALRQQVNQQIEALMENEGSHIRQAVQAHAVHPYDTACGEFSRATITWSPGGTALSSEVDYERSIGRCFWIDIYTATVAGQGQRNTVLWWDHDQYASWSTGTGCPQIPLNGGLSRDRYEAQPAGYYYENWVKNNACQWGSGTFWHNDMLLN